MPSILDSVKSTSEKLVELVLELPGSPHDRIGGVLTYCIGGDLFNRFVIPIGSTNPSKGDMYERISQEKAFRLHSDWLREPREAVSSWQTRDPDNNKYGGAILLSYDSGSLGDIISF